MAVNITSDRYRKCMSCGQDLVDRVDHEGRIRKACSDQSQCRFVFYDAPTVVVAALVEHEHNGTSEFILARNIAWPANTFGLITGFLEKGEAITTGVLREVAEELGLNNAYIESLIGVYDFVRANQVIIAYHVKAKGEITPHPEEIAEYKRVPLERLRPWNFGTGMAVRDFLERKQRSADDSVAKAKL